MPYSPLRLSTLPIACAGLLALALPIAPAQARTDSEYRAREADYRFCATNLVSTGLSEIEAAAACAAALAPRDIGDCVNRLYDNTELQPGTILTGCRQVRRPVDLASCVVDIRTATVEVAETDILESCRRSLLPGRYANCVVGLRESTSIAEPAALGSCLQAGDRPRNLRPNFVPASQGIPTTPRSGVSTEGANVEDNTQTVPSP